LKKDLVKRLVVFSIMMETHDGIMGKDPIYILEKFDAATSFSYPESLLDSENRKKLEKWMKKFGLS